jgi:hypothetical protein
VRLTARSRFTQLAQKEQDGERELQPSSVPHDFPHKPEVPSQADGEEGENHQRDDSTRRENASAYVW